MSAYFAIFASAFISVSAMAGPFPGAEAEIPEFHQVSGGLYRGGRPSARGLQELAKLGIKTIINLENIPETVAAEAGLAADISLTSFSRPMSGFFQPSNENVDNILALLADSNNYPIFVHCQHGQDRTGLIVGLFRVFQQGWTAEEAYQEMWNYNFHAFSLFPLYAYFRGRTAHLLVRSVSP